MLFFPYIWGTPFTFNFTILIKLLFYFLLIAATTLPGQAQWVIQPTPLPANKYILGINVVDNNTVWAISFYDQLIRTTNGGASWTVLNINNPSFTSDYYIRSLFALDANTAWIVATDFQSVSNNNYVSKVFKTTNGGQTWSHQSTAYPNTPSWSHFIYFFDANNGVTGGNANGGYFEIYTTSNGGANWTRVPSTNLPPPTQNDASDYAIHFKAGNTVWFGAKQMRVFKSIDQGLTWTVSNTGFPILAQGYNEVEAIAFTDQNNGLVAVGSDLRRTIDGGNTWTSVNYTGPFFDTDLKAVPGTTNTFVSVNSFANNPGSSYTADGGNTWISLENTILHNNVTFLDRHTGWSSGLGKMHKFTGNPLSISKDIAAASDFTISPNPSTGIFNVSGGLPVQTFIVEVYNLTGLKVAQQQSQPFRPTKINLSNQPKGIYLAKILSNSQIITKKIVLQ